MDEWFSASWYVVSRFGLVCLDGQSRAVAPGNAEGSWGHSGCLWDLKGEVGGATAGSQMPEPEVRRYLSCRALAVLAIPVPQVIPTLRTGGRFCVRLQFTQEVVLHGKCPSINFTEWESIDLI